MEAIRNYFYGEYRARLLVGIIIPLVVADGILSNFVVTQGIGLEVNPLSRMWVIDPRFLIVKIVAGILVALILWDMFKRNQRFTFIANVCLVIVCTVILYWNVFVYFLVMYTRMI